MLDGAIEGVRAVLAHLLSLSFLFSPLYLASTVAIAWAVWRWGRRTGEFVRFLFPRELYRHPSTWVDVKLTLLNLWLLSTTAFSALFFAPWVATALLEVGADRLALGPVEGTSLTGGLATALLLILVQDFCRFLNHYVHHKATVLWPFHAVHHSAEVLTPVTFYRAHPMYYALQRLLSSVALGAVMAAAVLLLVGRVEEWVLWLGTLTFQVYVFLGGHLRHSHVALRYGRVLEHVLISPAQHQLHHSSDPRHHDRNFGEIFAIWDWMFGTLYITDGTERLVFGIADADGVRLEQPYPTLRAALLQPFRESAEALLAPARGAAAAAARAPEGAEAAAAGAARRRA